MGLENKLTGEAKTLAARAVDGARSYIGGTKEKIFRDLRDKYLSKYFTGISDDERRDRESKLERYVEASVTKYDSDLGGIKRKATSKGSMALAFLNDIYTIVSKAPVINNLSFTYLLFGLKTLTEIPSLYRYMKKSHDWYGAAKWALMKPINYIIPFVGRALESGSFDRMVKKRVSYEARNKFLESIGVKTETEKAKSALRRPIGETLNPNPVPYYEPLPSYA